jgi:hypothetical protein
MKSHEGNRTRGNGNMRIGQQARNLRPQRSFWPGAGRGANLDLISTALTRAGAVVVVTGGGAMGKTRLALEAMARIEAVSIPCRTVAGNSRDDLNAIIEEMARLPEPRSSDTSRARALLVVDQAEDAGARTLERLILIAGKTSIAVMLVGRAELVGTLVRSVPEQVCDLITRYVALEPLDTDQTAEFVAHCLGEEAVPVTCGSDALRRIAAHSHGVPGIVDRLMADAVRLARLSRSARLTATVIDMIADEEHPPAEGPVTEPPEPPVPSFRRKGKPVATAQPEAHHPIPRQPASHQIAAHPTADGTRSMRTVLTGLQEKPAALYGHEDHDGGLDFLDPGGPDWPKPSANLLQPPARPARRIPPWAGGIAFVVVATSAIALQHYLQAGAPILTPADGSRTVVSSLLGDTGMRPAAPPPAVRTAETAQPVAPVPVHTALGGGGQVPVAGHFQGMQVAVVESRMLDAPADAVTTPPVMAEAAAEPSPEPPAATMPEPEMVPPDPPAPAESVLSEPELPNLESEAIAPAEPELPMPAAENLSEPEEIPAQALPMEPVPPAPTAESPPEQAPADTATESAPSNAVEPPIPETPTAETSPPPEPVPSEPVVSEPAPLEPPAAVAVPELAPEPEPTMAEPTPPPTAEPEPTIAEPTPPPAAEPEPTMVEPTPPPTPEPTPTVAEPTPPPASEPEPTVAEPTPPPTPEPEPTVAEPTPPPAPEPTPTVAEPTPPPTPEPEPTMAEPAPQPAPAAEPPAPAVVTAAPPPPPPPAAIPATPKPSSIAESVLLERGDRLLALGDIASARLLYETAAASGSARGALLVGRTLDPAYLRSLGTRGVAGDPARAADWYEKAAKLGDDSATAHLEALERR